VSSLLAFLAIITLILKTWVEYRQEKQNKIMINSFLRNDMSIQVKNIEKHFGAFHALKTSR
jgi:uncharacterized membrane-anchored protein